MNFFCTKKHLLAYQQKMKLQKEDIFTLTARQGLLMAEKLFGF